MRVSRQQPHQSVADGQIVRRERSSDGQLGDHRRQRLGRERLGKAASRAASSHGSIPSRVNAEMTLSGIPFCSSPIEAKRKSFRSEWSSENRAANIMIARAQIKRRGRREPRDLLRSANPAPAERREADAVTADAPIRTPEVAAFRRCETFIGLPSDGKKYHSEDPSSSRFQGELVAPPGHLALRWANRTSFRGTKIGAENQFP